MLADVFLTSLLTTSPQIPYFTYFLKSLANQRNISRSLLSVASIHSFLSGATHFNEVSLHFTLAHTRPQHPVTVTSTRFLVFLPRLDRRHDPNPLYIDSARD